jgi:hypothetical protein
VADDRQTNRATVTAAVRVRMLPDIVLETIGKPKRRHIIPTRILRQISAPALRRATDSARRIQ